MSLKCMGFRLKVIWVMGVLGFWADFSANEHVGPKKWVITDYGV
jgi:hypothetical protein